MKTRSGRAVVNARRAKGRKRLAVGSYAPGQRPRCIQLAQTPMRASLPATARLHRPSEYALALKGKRIARGALLVVTTPREAPQGASRPRLGLIVAKRCTAKAVTRNTIQKTGERRVGEGWGITWRIRW